MRTRKSTLELTPLLDVILIILFVFMMMFANQLNQSTQTKKQAQEKVDEALEELDLVLADIKEAEDKIEQLENDYETLQQSSADIANQLNKQRKISDEQQETAENLAKAIAEFIDANDDDIKKLLDENKAPSANMLESITSPEDIAEELLKFEALSRQFYFIDIELKTLNSRLYINNKSTSIGISSDEIAEATSRQNKVNEIKNLIEDDMEKRQGGSQMVFITLKVHDRKVYQDSWETVWDAIGEIQEKYGTDKIFRAHITIIND